MSVGTGDFKQLLYAARDGDIESVKYWVTRGAALNFLHAEFFVTPLHLSIRNGHHNVTEYLLDHGADPFLREGYGEETPLSLARAAGDRRTLALLEKHGVNTAPGPIGRLKEAISTRLYRWVAF